MELASCGGSLSIKQISQGTGISESYLEQIFFVLRKAGLLCTIRGKKGGFSLNGSAQQITAGMVVRAVEGSLVPVACVDDLSACSSPARDQCVTRRLWVNLSHTINRILDGLTLKQLKEQFKQSGGVL